MDYSVNSLRSTPSTSTYDKHILSDSANPSSKAFSLGAINANPDNVNNIANGLLTILTGSSIAQGDESAPDNNTSDTATSRYTGNACNQDGLTKSIAENGLIYGSAGVVGGVIQGATSGAELGGVGGGPWGALGGAVVGAGIGVASGIVGGGVAHELGCN